MPNTMILDVPDRKLGSMVRINGLFHLLINVVYCGYNLHLLTFDPNFQMDIQVPTIVWYLLIVLDEIVKLCQK